MQRFKYLLTLLCLLAISATALYACGDTTTPTPVQSTPSVAIVIGPTNTTTTAAPTVTTAPAQPTATVATVVGAPTSTSVTPGNSGVANSNDPVTLLRQSGQAMKGVTSYHITLKTQAAGASTTGEGDVIVPDRARLTIDTGTGVSLQAIIITDTTYTQVPGVDTYIKAISPISILGASTDTSAFADLAQNATIVGDETLDGVSTTHVKFGYSLDQAADMVAQQTGQPNATPSTGLGSASADLWIEKSTGYLHRFGSTSTVAGTQTSTTVTYSKFNEQVTPPIVAPTNIQEMPTLPTLPSP